MPKIDLKKELKHLYSPSAKQAVVVDVPTFNYLMVDGKGHPEGSQEYQEALEALYGLSYTLKFASKQGDPPRDYVVMPLEGLWWMADGKTFDMAAPEEWRWTSLIMQPDHLTPAMVEQATAQLRQKKDPVALDKVRFEPYEEGRAVQIMHIGPYAEEGPTLEKLHAFAAENGLKLHGKHHEIYLSDPRRTAPERLKTVLRHPVK